MQRNVIKLGRNVLVLGANLAASRTSPLTWMRSVRLAQEAIRRGAQQKWGEFAPLLALAAAREPAAILEIGSAAGGSFFAWCDIARADAKIVAIDLPGLYGDAQPTEDSLQEYAKAGQEAVILWGDSHDPAVVQQARQIAPRYDLIFIDGDHSYDGVKADYETYAPLVRPGGLIAFHDIVETTLSAETTGGPIEVPRFWAELKRTARHAEFTSPDDRGWGGAWGGIGVIFV